MTIDKKAKKLLLDSLKLTSHFRYGKPGCFRFAGICPACDRDHGDEDFQQLTDEKGYFYIMCPATYSRVYEIYA